MRKRRNTREGTRRGTEWWLERDEKREERRNRGSGMKDRVDRSRTWSLSSHYLDFCYSRMKKTNKLFFLFSFFLSFILTTFSSNTTREQDEPCGVADRASDP
jgi:hypothetical protein